MSASSRPCRRALSGTYERYGASVTPATRARSSKRTGSSATVPSASNVPASGVPAVNLTRAGCRLGHVRSFAVSAIGATRRRAGGVTEASSKRTRPSSTATSPISSASAPAVAAPASRRGRPTARAPPWAGAIATTSAIGKRPARSRSMVTRGRARPQALHAHLRPLRVEPGQLHPVGGDEPSPALARLAFALGPGGRRGAGSRGAVGRARAVDGGAVQGGAPAHARGDAAAAHPRRADHPGRTGRAGRGGHVHREIGLDHAGELRRADRE